MASRYWVGGTANWDSTAGTKWATTSGGAGGASVPTTADDVFLDANSGAGTVTITSDTGAKSITCTGFTGTLSSTVSNFTVAGSLTLASTMTTSNLSFKITATGTVTTAGKSLTTLTVAAGIGGTVILGSALTLTSSATLTVSSGTFTTSASNYSITAQRLDSTSGSTRTITLNGSTLTLSGANASAPALEFLATGLTFNANTSTINLSSSVAGMIGGGRTFNNVSFTSTSASSSPKFINDANTFANLTFTATSAADIAPYEFGANQTITTFVCAGASAIRRIFLASDTIGTRRTLTVTTWSSITDVDFRDIGMNSSRSGTRLGNCGNNNNITFTAARTVYWNLAGTQDWSATGWATTSGGTPAVNNFPLAQDTIVFDDTGAAGTVNVTDDWNIGTLDMSARTTAMTLGGAGSFSVYGDWTFGAGVTDSRTNYTYFRKNGTQTITSAGKSFYIISADHPSGTINLSDAFTATTAIALVQSTFNAGSYSVTTAQLTAPSATVGLGTGTWTITGTGNCWSCSSATITGTGEIVLSNNTTTARSFLGKTGSVYGKLTIGGDTSTSTTTIAGVTMTFSEIASTKTVAHTIVFPNTTTTVGAFTVQGSAGNVVTLSRTGASGTFTLAKSGSGVVSSDYLSISNSTATPSNTWYAGANSTDGGGNTGWIFTAAPGGGNFIAFFM